MMKKHIRILLYCSVIAAVIVLAFNNREIFIKSLNNESETKVVTKVKKEIKDSSDTKQVIYNDPFYCEAFMAKAQIKPVKTSKKATKKRPPKAVVKLPSCKLSGIVYNSQNPMAMLDYKGTTTIIKEGDIIDSMRVDNIGKDSVKISYKGKLFCLKK